MVIFDLANPYSPARFKEIKTATYFDVIPYQGVLVCFVAHGILLYDISEPLAPVKLSAILK
jgi:hypothetical protein